MKKTTIWSMALLMMATASGFVQAQSIKQQGESTSSQIYNFDPWSSRGIIKLFAKAADDGRQFPTQQEFEAAGIYLDLEFSRSHVRPAEILEQSTEKNLISSVYPTRRLWLNIPTGKGKITGGYPSGEFHSDVFSMWNYTHIFGCWNHNLNQAPGSWADAAHKHGTQMYSGIEFFDTTGGRDGSSSEYVSFITSKNPDGTFKYVDALINACLFFGHDGINYNWEDTGYNSKDVLAFHQAVQKKAADLGVTLHIGLYTSMQSFPSVAHAKQLLGTPEDGKIYDMMLNYSAGDFAISGVPTSLKYAEEAIGTAEDIYQGVWIVGMDRKWSDMAAESRKKMNLCLWGEHAISRFFQYTVGTSLMNTQENYQLLLEKSFSGGNRNPLNRPNLSNSGNTFQVKGASEADSQMKKFGGLASLIPERASIKGDLPFQTNFTLGNGEIYFYKGKKTHGPWYNMGQQDYMPTYRWLVTAKGNMASSAADIDVRFTHEDAYIGGSSIRLSGTTTNGNDIVLYRTNLTVSASNPKVTVALKGAAGATHLSVILKKANSTNWIEVPCTNLTSTSWETQTNTIPGLGQSDIIEYIGLRVNGATPKDYKILVGQLRIEDDRAAVTPAPIVPESFIAEVKEETASSLSLKLNWTVDDNGYPTQFKERGMVYNDEVDIDHFEILYKDGEEGTVAEMGRTSSWSAFVGNIEMDEDTDPYIGVRSVSVDLKSVSPVVWLKIPRSEGKLPESTLDVYDPSYLDPASEGAATAKAIRFWAVVKTENADKNINYTRKDSVGGENYLLIPDTLKVRQGQAIELYLRAAGSAENLGNDGLNYCIVKGYADYDLNHVFDVSNDAKNEEVFTYGTLNSGDGNVLNNAGYTWSFTIPTDAAPGVSRLRVVASDAWFAHPGPSGGTSKGHSLDIPMVITGSNPARAKNITYRDARDEGTADEPDNIFTTGIETVTANSVNPVIVYPSLVENTVYFQNVDKVWIYSLDGQMVKFLQGAPESADLSNLTSGVYLVKAQKGQIVRSQKIVKK